MRSLVGVILLVIAAVALAALMSKIHGPSTASPLPNEVPDTTTQTNNSKPNTPAKPALTGAARDQAFDKVKDGAIHATLEVANRGTMVLELYPKAAPKTVAHFVDLAKKHFYDGIKFHRVVPDFVVQAGDPESRNTDPSEFDAKHVGAHGSGTTVPLEAGLPHIQGSIGLARAQDPDSGDSQFYINLKDNANLDGQYCVFGRVIQGADIADKIQVGDTITKLSVP